jgi:hypothetical protein
MPRIAYWQQLSDLAHRKLIEISNVTFCGDDDLPRNRIGQVLMRMIMRSLQDGAAGQLAPALYDFAA